ncbi:hypothetical protein [Pediococcus acidilactici]|uniref:hypothetical protein n=1 Tax=Pediococcus acidilactici TaxID=1254 RepID=UPI00232BC2DB|nr:hypothetical protein [Pediococcus acidilactici]MDB8858802.1 hypothetical protein [Pediococcus acidilactici]MDB8861092.1 hypothetical protein [Pediococcus acidilactici]MDB8862016.1 hypothetical protein [Pediococcus acidilactici]MDB8865983.1 hypothetical protein [Pediococcus acidilactici]
MADTINTNLGTGLDDHYRDDLNGNFKVIVSKFGKQANQLKGLETDHTKLFALLKEIKQLEEDNAQKLKQQHLNMQQIVEVMQYFDTPVDWDGENIVIRKDI